MLDLPQVTLICLTGKLDDLESHRNALEKSSEGIKWGSRKIIVDTNIHNIDDWNKGIIYDLHRYVQTDYAMLVHPDGYVIHPEKWNPDWLQWDYLGAPWPLPTDDYSYRTPDGEIVRVGNSVSLRSKRVLELPSQLNLPWRSYYGNTNEDGFLCVHNRRELERHGCRFAPLEAAIHFSREHSIPENEGIETFAFHTVDI